MKPPKSRTIILILFVGLSLLAGIYALVLTSVSGPNNSQSDGRELTINMPTFDKAQRTRQENRFSTRTLSSTVDFAYSTQSQSQTNTVLLTKELTKLGESVINNSLNTTNILPHSSENAPIFVFGGYCAEQRFVVNHLAITAMTFAPDGRLFLALDPSLTGNEGSPPPSDPFHPSRSIWVYDTSGRMKGYEILSNSSRITGLFYSEGSLYVSRSGEVGRIPENGNYETLAQGFAVNGVMFHANNGITIVDGWIYLVTGGVRDGYVDGPYELQDEQVVQNSVSDGNLYAARIVRAPVEKLLAERNIDVFSTVAFGVRNPYGISTAPNNDLWFTDNGVSGILEEFMAGDEVNLLTQELLSRDSKLPHYGFPLTLYQMFPKNHVPPIIALPNSSAPTEITWAYETVFWGQYGRNPGLYKLDRDADGRTVATRIVDAWPIISLATAPDGNLWFGMGDGSLYRLALGC